ncbi:MAG TPA: TetR/AcrR family transcriptional regulator [Phenylobacterium sp.]|nr:TetR/AcrR family transcriptional regulator [Phenylobacterium sp.]
MDDIGDGRTLVYRSDNIVERRRRILREARRMIAESGLPGFSVRVLATRAGIAQKTLYNAFGSKEGVIAVAIRQYMDDFNARTPMRFEPGTLEERLEKLIKVHSRNVQIRPYTTAIMAVYNSFTAHSSLRTTIRNVAERGLQPYADALHENDELALGVTPESFVQSSMTMTYAILTDWCMGEIEDDQLVDRITDAFLCGVVASTRRRAHDEARRWLEDLRGKRPSWVALRRLAEVSAVDLELRPDASPS